MQFIHYIFRFLLHNIFGYKVTNPHLLEKIKKGKHVVVFAHTTTWEFIIGALLFGVGYKIPNLVGISYICNFKNVIFSFVLNKMNFYPVDNNKKNNVVTQISDILNKHDNFVFAISPEGSREFKDRFRSGYYHIAKNTKADIVIFHLDFHHHTIGFQNILELDNDIEKMNAKIADEFSKHYQLYPENTFYGKKKQTSFIRMTKTNTFLISFLAICFARKYLGFAPS